MRACRVAAGVALAQLVWTTVLTAQEPAPPPSALQRAVDGYFDEPQDDKARQLLDQVLAMPAANPEALLAAVRHCSAKLATEMKIAVPHHDDDLIADVRTPKGHDRSKPRLPVVLDISAGHNLGWLKLKNVITVCVPGYTPPEFSDEGRDGFLKILRAVAHAAHGDADRMWLCGFSWAGHACYDTAEHRPGILRGIVPMGGGPRRVHFRVLKNLQGVVVLAFCGMKDDKELVWSLKEVNLRKQQLGLDYHLILDPEKGHTHPLLGIDGVAQRILETGPRDPGIPAKGTLLVDLPLVEIPLLRVDKVDKRKVAMPRRVTVRAGLSADQTKRAQLRAMAKRVATLDWTLKTSEKGGKSTTYLTLKTKGVRACTVWLRGPTFQPGQNVTVKARSKTVYRGPLTIDPKTLLQEARRTGDRLWPVFAAVQVKL